MLHHALRIEKRAIERDGVTHDTEEALLVAIEQRQDDLLEFVIERRCILGAVVVYGQTTVIGSNRPSCNPFYATFQPSSTLNEGTPLSAAFIPLVPEASSGGCGVLSQTSTPAVSKPPRARS